MLTRFCRWYLNLRGYVVVGRDWDPEALERELRAARRRNVVLIRENSRLNAAVAWAINRQGAGPIERR